MTDTSTIDFTHASYERLIQSALDNRYVFVPFLADWSAINQLPYACVLRHDCDNDLMAAAEMSAIDARYGVQATYFILLRSPMYNLLSLPHRRLIENILNQGHRIGLHFDALPLIDLSVEQIVERVERDRASLSGEFGTAVDVASFHQPDSRIIDGQVRTRCLNTYDRRWMSDFLYISDSNMRFRHHHPMDVFRKRETPRVHLNIHPEWWTDRALPLAQKWERILSNNTAVLRATLREREAAYYDDQASETVLRGDRRIIDA